MADPVRIPCEHCGEPMTKARGVDNAAGVSLIKGAVAIVGNRCEATCSSCGKETRLPFQFIVTVPKTGKRRIAP